MKRKLFATLLLAGSSFAESHFSFGVNIATPGAYYAPTPPVAPRYAYRRPPYPGPGYVWIDGHYDFNRGRYFWRPGYWARPPYVGAYWIAPRHDGRRYYAGYWERRDYDRDDRYRQGFRR